MNQVRCDSGLLLILLRRLDLHYEVDVKSDAQIMYLAPRLNTQKLNQKDYIGRLWKYDLTWFIRLILEIHKSEDVLSVRNQL